MLLAIHVPADQMMTYHDPTLRTQSLIDLQIPPTATDRRTTVSLTHYPSHDK